MNIVQHYAGVFGVYTIMSCDARMLCCLYEMTFDFRRVYFLESAEGVMDYSMFLV